MTQEALKLALETLEEINKLSIGENAIYLPAEIDKAMDAIKEALAQPEQEPVKYSDYEPDGVHHTTPPQRTWVNLTDEEIEQIGLSNYIKVVRETEAKLKQKNMENT